MYIKAVTDKTYATGARQIKYDAPACLKGT